MRSPSTRKKTSEYGYLVEKKGVGYKRANNKYPLMNDVADHYKSIKEKVAEDRDTIMVYFKNGARLFMSKKSGYFQYYYIGTSRFDNYHMNDFTSIEQIINGFEEYVNKYLGTARFYDVLSEVDKMEL